MKIATKHFERDNKLESFIIYLIAFVNLKK